MITWEAAANYCEEVFGSFVNWKERFFICPECQEPILEADFEDHDWSYCPVCEVNFTEVE